MAEFDGVQRKLEPSPELESYLYSFKNHFIRKVIC